MTQSTCMNARSVECRSAERVELPECRTGLGSELESELRFKVKFSVRIIRG